MSILRGLRLARSPGDAELAIHAKDELSPHDADVEPARSVPGVNRRVFLTRFVGGVAVAVPALAILAKTSPAVAAPGCCSISTYVVYQGHDCGPYDTCPNNSNSHRCIGTYYVYCTGFGSFCYSYNDDEGPCGP
jgi:hypothetical protein